jgi:hypothetical protein
MTVKQIQAEIRELRREMRANGIKRTSCFNGGLDRDTYRYNARMFDLETQLGEAKRKLANA